MPPEFAQDVQFTVPVILLDDSWAGVTGVLASQLQVKYIRPGDSGWSTYSGLASSPSGWVEKTAAPDGHYDLTFKTTESPAPSAVRGMFRFVVSATGSPAFQDYPGLVYVSRGNLEDGAVVNSIQNDVITAAACASNFLTADKCAPGFIAGGSIASAELTNIMNAILRDVDPATITNTSSPYQENLAEKIEVIYAALMGNTVTDFTAWNTQDNPTAGTQYFYKTKADAVTAAAVGSPPGTVNLIGKHAFVMTYDGTGAVLQRTLGTREV